MINNINYEVGDYVRLKTKEEFLSAYGVGWRDVGLGWNTSMDIYLGEVYQIIRICNHTYTLDIPNTWVFDKGMFSFKPYYNSIIVI